MKISRLLCVCVCVCVYVCVYVFFCVFFFFFFSNKFLYLKPLFSSFMKLTRDLILYNNKIRVHRCMFHLTDIMFQLLFLE